MKKKNIIILLTFGLIATTLVGCKTKQESTDKQEIKQEIVQNEDDSKDQQVDDSYGIKFTDDVTMIHGKMICETKSNTNKIKKGSVIDIDKRTEKYSVKKVMQDKDTLSFEVEYWKGIILGDGVTMTSSDDSYEAINEKDIIHLSSNDLKISVQLDKKIKNIKKGSIVAHPDFSLYEVTKVEDTILYLKDVKDPIKYIKGVHFPSAQ